ncbi:MAG: carbon storage regulator CsrA [Brevinema sp.]
MLILSRKENESIIINGEIEIKIVSIKPDQIKIGIVAPKEVKVYRQEIFAEIIKENERAQNPSLEALKSIGKIKN